MVLVYDARSLLSLVNSEIKKSVFHNYLEMSFEIDTKPESVLFDHFKVTGDSLLIHEFAYSLFIGLFSVTSVHLKEMY